MVILTKGNVFKLKLRHITLKDVEEIPSQCDDLKDNCKMTVKESVRRFFFF